MPTIEKLALFVLAAVLLAMGCSDERGKCPDSLPTSSAQWSAVTPRQECADVADVLNESGFSVAGDAGGEGNCTGRETMDESGGMCRATIASECESGLSFELVCTVRSQGGADCAVTLDAAELEAPCRLRVLLR
jgi:hypothetical protein